MLTYLITVSSFSCASLTHLHTDSEEYAPPQDELKTKEDQERIDSHFGNTANKKETLVDGTEPADGGTARYAKGDENATRSQPARDTKEEIPSLNEDTMLQDKELEGEA